MFIMCYIQRILNHYCDPIIDNRYGQQSGGTRLKPVWLTTKASRAFANVSRNVIHAGPVVQTRVWAALVDVDFAELAWKKRRKFDIQKLLLLHFQCEPSFVHELSQYRSIFGQAFNLFIFGWKSSIQGSFEKYILMNFCWTGNLSCSPRHKQCLCPHKNKKLPNTK